jgi:hypothetical protein
MSYDSDQLESEKRSIVDWLFSRKSTETRVTDEKEKLAIHRIGTIDRLLAKLRNE